MRRLLPTGCLLAATTFLPARAQEPAPAATPAAAEPAKTAEPTTTPFTRAHVDQLAWRNVGPVNPMGRMTDLDIHPTRQSTWFIGTAGGGVWKTSNAGTTWTSVFDYASTVSIGDIAIAPSDPDLVWVGTGEENARNSVQWGDGVYKSTDGGSTWTHMGLRDTFQIGHIAIHPTDKNTVYVAALGKLWADSEERGVYRTRDGGSTWQRVLFTDVRTGCIDVRVHPQDPNVVFACLYERKRDGFDGNDPSVRLAKGSGLYRSTDGGDTWTRLQNGLPTCTWGRSGIDLFAPEGDVVFAIIETERTGWAKGDRKDRLASDAPDREPGQAQDEEGERPQRPTPAAPQGGRGGAVLGIGTDGDSGPAEAAGAILRSVTAGGPAATAGLQAGDRITKYGDEVVKTYADLLEIVRDARPEQKATFTYVRGETTATVEVTFGRADDPIANAAGRPNGPYSGRLFGQDANKQTFQGELGFETGGVFRSEDRGETWTRLNSLTERPFYYSVIRVDPRSAQNLYCVGTSLWGSKDGGAKFEAIQRGIHVDFHAIWIDPDDSDHLIALCDGGVNETFDRGASWQVHRGFSAAQFYDAVADNSVPYRIVGGLQDNGTWVLPSRTRYREGITAADCVTIFGGDGFGAQTDPIEPWIVYATSQNGALGLVDLRSGQQARVSRDRLPNNVTPTFNWDSPFVLSPHNRLVVWHAGSHVFRGDRYAHLDSRAARPGQGPLRNADTLRMKAVSPRLGRTEAGTAVSIAESPRVQGLVYVGTDDGALWRSEDNAVTWTRIDANLPVFTQRYVSDLVPSHFADNRIYLTLDGHREDDFATYALVSEDRGASWRSLDLDLPTRETCYAILEDPRNEDLLFLGTEFGCHVSLDRGDHWFPLGSGLPTVAVRDLFIQDRDSDLIAATHGRGVFVLDIEGLRQLTSSTAKQAAHLCAVEPAVLWRMTSRGHQGHKEHAAKNPPYGVTFHVVLREAPASAPVLTIHDITGTEVAKVEGKAVAGLQAIQWDARANGRLAKPGSYSVRWAEQKDVAARAFTLAADPEVGVDAAESGAATQR